MASQVDTFPCVNNMLKKINNIHSSAKPNSSALWKNYLPELSTSVTKALTTTEQSITDNLTKLNQALSDGAGGADDASLTEFIKINSALDALESKIRPDQTIPITATDINTWFTKLADFDNAKKNLVKFLSNDQQGEPAQHVNPSPPAQQTPSTEHHKHAVFATLHVVDGEVVIEVTPSEAKNGYFTMRNILRKERDYKLTAHLRQQLFDIALKRYGFISHIPSFVYNLSKDQKKDVGSVVAKLRASFGLSADEAAGKEDLMVSLKAEGACDKKVLLDLAALTPETFNDILENDRLSKKNPQTPLGNTMEFVIKNAVFEKCENDKFANWSSFEEAAKRKDVPQLQKIVGTLRKLTAFLNDGITNQQDRIMEETIWDKLFPVFKAMFSELYISSCKNNNVKMGPHDRAPCLYVQQTNKTARNITMMAWLDEKIHEKAIAKNTNHAISKLAKRVKGATAEQSKLTHIKKASAFVNKTLAQGDAPQHVKNELFAELKNRVLGYRSAKSRAANNKCRFDDDLEALEELVRSGVFDKACGKEVSWDELIKPWANKRPSKE